MNNTPESAKCSCTNCGGHLEFDTADAGRQATCPHCGNGTILCIPATAALLPAQSSSPVADDPAVPTAYPLAAATPARTPAPRPVVVRRHSAPPRDTNPFAPQAAKASWVSFLFAYGFAYFARGFTDPLTKPIFALGVALFMVIGFVLGIIALFGIRKYGTKGILIPALVGIILNGVILGAMVTALVVGLNKRHILQESRRKTEATLNDYLQQAKSGAPVGQIRSTGNPQWDAAFRVIVDLNNDVTTLLAKVDADLTQINEECASSVFQHKAAMKLEMDKRAAAQRVIQKARDEVSTMIDSAQQRLAGLPLDRNMKQETLGNFEPGGTARMKYDELLSLALAREKAEFDLLQFMSSEFGRYRLLNGDASFSASSKQEEYTRLSQRVEDALAGIDDYERRRNELLEATPEQVKQPLK